MKTLLISLLALGLLTELHAGKPLTTKPLLGTLPVAKVLFLGNSITLHPPAPEIGWTGNWGMAASEEEKDYVHLLTADLAKATDSRPSTKVRNIAEFERKFETYDIAKELKEELEYKADVVVIAISENVPELATEEARGKFAMAFAGLIRALSAQGQPAIFVRSSFWPDPTKDEVLSRVSADWKATYINIAALGADSENIASSERKFEHDGVAGHPGDKGMQAIADAIFKAMQKKAGLLP